MKILLVDTATDGHHISYLSELIKGINEDITLVLPEYLDIFKDQKLIVFSQVDLVKKDFYSYRKWMKELSKIAGEVKPDIIHFLTGDVYYKYFGFGLGLFREYRMLMTLHWVRPGKLKRLSLKEFSRKADNVVVHSSYLLKQIKQLGVRNGIHIEYPHFKQSLQIEQTEAQKFWEIRNDVPVILALGNTRLDKGLDILLGALNKVNCPFTLLVAGKPETFDEEYIHVHSAHYSDNVVLALRYLSDEEVEYAVSASDIVVLPYRFVFNGASGPLVEGVYRNKCIIGSDHANLGDTIRENHLGYTFETENSDDLARVLNKALRDPFSPDEKYLNYKESLSPSFFVDRYWDVYKGLIHK